MGFWRDCFDAVTTSVVKVVSTVGKRKREQPEEAPEDGAGGGRKRPTPQRLFSPAAAGIKPPVGSSSQQGHGPPPPQRHQQQGADATGQAAMRRPQQEPQQQQQEQQPSPASVGPGCFTMGAFKHQRPTLRDFPKPGRKSWLSAASRSIPRAAEFRARRQQPEKAVNLQNREKLRQGVNQYMAQERSERHATPPPTETIDLTGAPSGPLPALRQLQPQQQGVATAAQPAAVARSAAAAAAAAGAAAVPPHSLPDIVRALKEEMQREEPFDLPAAPSPAPSQEPAAAGDAEMARLGEEADRAQQKALQLNAGMLKAAARVPTAAERAQWEGADRIQQELKHIEQRMEQLRMRRTVEAAAAAEASAFQQQQERRPQQRVPKLQAAAEEEVIEISSSEESQEAAPSASFSAAVAASEEEASAASQQLAAVSLEEAVPPLVKSLLAALPPKWHARYKDATDKDGDRTELLVSHPRTNIELKRKDMLCMAPSQWLNDEVMNLYIGLLMERDMRLREEGSSAPRCHFFSSFFCNKLYKDGGYNYGEVRRWTLAKRLKAAGQLCDSVLDCDMVVMPVHQGVHWVCAVVDLRNRRLAYYDSLQGEDHECLESLAKWLRDEYKNKRGEEREDVLSWPRDFPKDIPQQLNGCDCGVFSLLYCAFLGAGSPLVFTQAQIQHFRVRITNELLEQRAD